MRRFALRFGVILAFSTAMVGSSVGMSACGAQGDDLDAGTDQPDSTLPDAGKDVQPDRTVVDSSDAADVKSDKVDVDVIDSAPDVVDAKPDVIDASDASDASDADAADAFVPEGTPCLTSGAVEARACGGCGTQERVCLDLGSGLKWQAWGSCKNEVVGGCVPGSVAFEECDLCGRRRKECTTSCTWITGICENQNPNACEPGVVEWVEGLSCVFDAGSPSTGRTRTCSFPDLDASADAAQTGCTWSNYASTCTNSPTSLTIPTTAGARIGQSVALTGSMPYVTYSTTAADSGCYQSSNLVPFAYVELVNPTSQTANITVWATLQADSGMSDGIRIVAYPGTANPPTNLANCVSQDSCYSSSCKLDAGFGLTGDAGLGVYYSPRVTIAPNSKIVLLVSESFNSYSYTSLPNLWVRTDSFSP